MKNLDELTITDIVSDIFTSSTIKKKRKDIIAYYEQQYQINLFGDGPRDNAINAQTISKRIDEILREDKAQQDPYLSYANSYYRKAKRRSAPINPSTTPDSNYMGKGGECMVMGELLFRGYNVNNMMVDEGIDLVASKGNVFYYIQVKTKNVEQQNRFYFQIKQERFDSFLGTQIRYILVARCSVKGEERTIYFTFSNNDIQRFMYNGVIPKPAESALSLSLKIEFDTRTGKAYMYDGRNRDDISFFMNNFNL